MLVRKLRLERAWSQETLAEVSGLSVRTIQRIERGGTASLESLGALAAVLETDVAILRKETDMMTPQTEPQSPAPAPEISAAEADALEYVRDIKGFYTHLATYVVVIAGLVVVWLFTPAEFPWFIWPAMGWGIGVTAHGLATFEVFSLFSPKWEQRMVQRRLGRRR